MKPLDASSSIEEIAGTVSTALTAAGITAVLSGGAAVQIYSSGLYVSRGLDFVSPSSHSEIESSGLARICPQVRQALCARDLSLHARISAVASRCGAAADSGVGDASGRFVEYPDSDADTVRNGSSRCVPSLAGSAGA